MTLIERERERSYIMEKMYIYFSYENENMKYVEMKNVVWNF